MALARTPRSLLGIRVLRKNNGALSSIIPRSYSNSYSLNPGRRGSAHWPQTNINSGECSVFSESEATYFPLPRVLYSARDSATETSRFNVLIDGLPADSSTDFSNKSKILNSFAKISLSSKVDVLVDVDNRIKLATAAFEALKHVFTDRHLDPKVKGRIYEAVCLSILLDGCEVRILREDLFCRMRSFHQACVRTMCNISSMYDCTPIKSLLARLGIEPFETYYHRKLHRCSGLISHMSRNQEQKRKLINEWGENTCPFGPQIRERAKTCSWNLSNSKNSSVIEIGDFIVGIARRCVLQVAKNQ